MRVVTKIIFLVMVCQAVFASDLATMENLGFSPNGRYFMFGQHVLLSQKGQARAEIGIVDVRKNVYVGGGRKKGSWDVVMWPSQNSRGALYELIEIHYGLKERYGINHLIQGKLLYTRENGDSVPAVATYTGDKGGDALSFRDFQKGREYSLTLNQDRRGNGESKNAAFYIDLEVKDNTGKNSSYVIGRKGYYREGIDSYEVVRVWSNPAGDSLIIVLSRKSSKDYVDYMIETLAVN